MDMYFIAILMLFIGGLLSLPVKENHKLKVCTLFTALSTVLMLVVAAETLISGNPFGAALFLSPVFGEINFVIDALSAFFIAVISIIGLLCTIYSNGYMKPYVGKGNYFTGHCFFLPVLIASMLLVVTVQNSLFFLIVWEIMSISSFFLVIFEGNKKEVLAAGIKYLVYMHISVIFITAAFALLSVKTQSYDFADYMLFAPEHKKLATIVLLLAFAGFGTKAGFAPFHNWLPDAHPAAPTHVSGIMSGVMIKTGIYGILRMLFVCGLPSAFIAYTILIVSVLTALWGGLYASVTQHDIKKLLAYHSMENIGIIGMGIGIGLLGISYQNPIVAVLGFSGGILHIANHAIFKSLLFLSAGGIYIKTHTRDIEQLGGLIKSMPYTAALFTTGSIAICALPPFNGFISEFLIYAAMISGLSSYSVSAFITVVLSLASLAAVGSVAILCFTKAAGIMLLGNHRSDAARKVTSDVSNVMILPMSVLALFTLIIGLFPQYCVLFVLSPVSMLLHSPFNPEIFSSIIVMMQTISLLFFLFLIIIAAVAVMRYVIMRKSAKHTTWTCAYNKPNARMQYTASSYTDLFVSAVHPLFKHISHIKTPKGIFPKDAYYEAETEDIEEVYILKPILKCEEKIISKFERIQSGNMQKYILAGLIFLIIATVGLIYFG